MRWFFVVLVLSTGCGTSVDPALFDDPPVPSCRGGAQACGSFRDVCRCEGQRGCSFHDSVKGEHHDRCFGEPEACDTLGTERRCEEQVGCVWK